MACRLNIKASNNKNSILYKDLVQVTNSPENAIDQYYYIHSDMFKKDFGDWEVEGAVDSKLLDANGEPKYSELSTYTEDINYAEVELGERPKVYKEILNILPEVRSKVEAKINDLEKLDKPPKALEQLNDLLKKLNEGTIDDSLPVFLKMSARHVNGMLNRATAEANKPDTDMSKLSMIYKDSQSYSIIANIQDSLNASDEIAKLLNDQTAAAETLNKMHKIEVIYIKESKKFLVESLHNHNPTWPKQSIRKWLDDSPRDVKYTEYMLEYLGDSSDKLLANISNVVMDANHEARFEAIEFNETLAKTMDALEKVNPSNNAEKMFSDIIVEKQFGELHILNLHAEYTGGKDKGIDAEYQRVQNLKSNKPELYNFLQLFTEQYMALQSALPARAQMGLRLPTVLKATRERAQGQTVKEKYANLADDAKKTLKKSNQDLETGSMSVDGSGEPIRQIPTFYTKRYDSVDFNNFKKAKFEELMAAGESEANANTLAEEYATQEAIKKNSKLVSKDLAYSLQAFHAMATNYAKKNAIIEVIESAQAVVGSELRTYTKLDSSGKKVMSKMFGEEAKETKILGPKSQAAKALNGFLNAQIYGQTQKELGQVTLFGTEVDVNKSLRAVNSYTSWVQMSMNLFAGIANLGTGEANSRIEAFGGEFYNRANFNKAHKRYGKDFTNILKDIGARIPRSFVGQLDQHYNILMDFQPKGTIKGTENTSAKRLLKTSMVFFMQNSGEHFMQTRAGMAVMDGIQAYDKYGKESGSLLDAHSVEKGRLKISDVYVHDKSGTLVKYNKAQQKRVANKMSAVLRKLFGNYSSLTANNMKQHAMGALVLKYRDWAYEGIVKRYGKKQYYENLEQKVEGFYRSGGRVILQTMKDLKNLEFSLMKENWAKLSEHDKANVRRMVTEVSMITALSIGGALLGKAGKMVKDEFGEDTFVDKMTLGSFNLMVYEVNRLFTEIAVFVDPREVIRLAQTPAASTSLVKAAWQLWAQVATAPMEQYDRGWREGEYKVWTRFEKFVPVYKNIKTLNPEGIEDRGVFYNID